MDGGGIFVGRIWCTALLGGMIAVGNVLSADNGVISVAISLFASSRIQIALLLIALEIVW